MNQEVKWVDCLPTFIDTLPVLDMPFNVLPDIYVPASTVLQVADGRHVYAFKWCYLSRRFDRKRVSFEPKTRSELRVKAMPETLNRLSKWFRFKNARPSSVYSTLRFLGQLLDWADQPEHDGRFEAILNDPDVALEALKGYHSFVRSQLQGHQLASETAGLKDQYAIACMSEIHGRVYKDYIEPLEARKGFGTAAPESAAVAGFGSTLQAIFDSAAEMVLRGDPASPSRSLRVSASDDTQTVSLRRLYGPLRLMELACVVYTGLVFMDSGANQSVLTQYEEPDDLNEQLADPDRINLTQRVIKFRAGGKEVEVFMSATTVTRLKTYLRIRQKLVAALGCADIAPLFIQCSYKGTKAEPIAIRSLDRVFLSFLKKKVAAVGATLPDVTLRQLRVYAQQKFVRTAPLAVAAKRMGHTVETAVRAYCKGQESTQRGEMAEFLGSLQKTVVEASEISSGSSGQQAMQAIPVGSCLDHGNPAPADSADAVAPDCSRAEGCFFCDKYRLHADEQDIRKLMSCRRVLTAIAPLSGDSIRGERIYTAVTDRIAALLAELKRRQPIVYEAVQTEVEKRGQLTRYWAGKLQQLHLLGMLDSNTGGPPLSTNQ